MSYIHPYSFHFFVHKCGNMPWKGSLWASGCGYAGKLCESRLWHRPSLQVVVVLSLERLNSAEWCADGEGTAGGDCTLVTRMANLFIYCNSCTFINQSRSPKSLSKMHRLPLAQSSSKPATCQVLRWNSLPFRCILSVGKWASASFRRQWLAASFLLPFSTILHHLAVSDSLRILPPAPCSPCIQCCWQGLQGVGVARGAACLGAWTQTKPRSAPSLRPSIVAW